MKTYFKIIALLCLLCMMLTASAQCPQGAVVLLSQEEVNEFGMLYPDCTEFEGSLQIGNIIWTDPATDIIDLSPLNNIIAIEGDLFIGKTDSSMTLAGLSGLNTLGGNFGVYSVLIADLTGLNNLTTIEGEFLGGNVSLVGLENLITIGGSLSASVESFQGLNSLTSIGGELFISENSLAENFIGLESLTSIGATLEIDENCGINSFEGLENLSYIGGDLDIDSECGGITNVSGLESLTTVEGSLYIYGVAATDFSGLNNLSTIGGGISLRGCGMNSLDGLESVTDFGSGSPLWSAVPPGEIRLTGNNSLTDISAINNLSIDELRLENNPNLSVCGIESICQYFAQGGTGTIANNAEGCNTVNEVAQSCGGDCPPTVVLLSQADVEEFGMLYPDCTEISGSVHIGDIAWGSDTTDINDLSPLSGISYIGGDLGIGKNDVSMSLAPLSNLDSIGGSLILGDKSPLNSLAGLEGVTNIGGDLELQSFTIITDFTGLNNLTSIGGDFYFNRTNLNDFAGLENLNTIEGRLSVGGHSGLANFQGLDNLTFIGGGLGLGEQSDIQSFIGLESLTTLGGELSISEDNGVGSFEGLENLSYIGGNLFVEDFGGADFTGLDNVTTIEGSIDIDLSGFTDFTGLNNLSALGGGVRLIGCNSLVSLAGLENITSFGYGDESTSNFGPMPGEINLWENQSLTDISAISYLPIAQLTLQDNSSLAVCGIESICEYLAQGGIATIENNAEGCNSVEEVIQSCVPLLDYTIQGNVFTDTNADCLQDAEETGLDNWLIKIEENGQLPRYAYTFGGGNYIALADSGAQYTLTAIPPNMLWDNICPTSELVSISADNPNVDLAFGANGSTLCPLLEVDVTAPFVRRCFESNYYVSYCNSGTAVAENAYVEVQLDPFFTYENATIEGVNLGENLYSFDVENIDVGECGTFRIDVLVDCDSTVLGQTHCVEAHIFPDEICTPIQPLWDGSSIKVDAQCLGDSIEFKIENVGTGDMSDPLEYLVVEDDLIWRQENFQLNSGDNETFYKAANGAFHRLEAEQSPGHPGNSMPSVFVEGCGENDNGEISIGFVNYYLLDEGDAFVSVDCQENVGSYDPNDKQAFPVGYGTPHFITDSTDLEYMIRFQNTGTDTAFNIVIRDMISPHLNIETLRPGVASHPYRYDIEGSNTAVFHFENIMLPDSNVNEAASHGFIKFNIQQKQNNPIGTHIMNEADIYFDFNEPIITNTVYHTIGADFRGIVTAVITPPQVQEAGVTVNVFPNPFNEYTQFEVKGETVKELRLSVHDMTGREVFQQKATHQQHITMKRNNLLPGVYVFRLMDEKQQLATGKLVIQ